MAVYRTGSGVVATTANMVRVMAKRPSRAAAWMVSTKRPLVAGGELTGLDEVLGQALHREAPVGRG